MSTEIKETTRRNRANVEINELTKTYWQSLPISDVAAILTRHGFDPTETDGIYCGHEGRSAAKVGPKTHLYFCWYRMDSGRYEITSYLS